MKTSALSAPFLEQVEKVVRKELTWGRVYVDTKNENRWYCTIEDLDYLPDENFIYRNMMFVHHNGLRAYLDESSDLIDQQRASLKHMITQFVMEIHQQLAELCSSQALPRQEDIKKFPAKLSLLDKPETASFIELLQSVDRFECFFDPQYREEAEPWRLIQDMEYCDDVSIQGTPGRLAMRISYLPGKEVRIAASFLEDKLDVNGASREWPMVFSFREDPKTLNFRTDPSFCSIHEPANVKNKLKNILNKQVWNMMKGHYCQALIPIPVGYPRMVEDLRILAKNKTKNMMAGVTVREIHVPSDQGAYAAALVVAPMEIVALLTDN